MPNYFSEPRDIVKQFNKNAKCIHCNIPLKNKYAKRCKICNAKYNPNKNIFRKGQVPWNKGKPFISGEEHVQWKRIEIECFNCHKKMKIIPSICKKVKRNFCSRECRIIWKKEFSRINNPMLGKKHSKETKRLLSLKAGGNGITGDYSEYGHKWTEELKEKIRNRDSNKCQICNMCDLEHFFIYNCNLPVHHINYNKQDNLESNLITLCFQCHTRTNYNRNYWKEFFYGKLVQRA